MFDWIELRAVIIMLLVLGLFGCGDDDADGLRIKAISAPDEFTVVVAFDGAAADGAGEALAYTIGSDCGPLAVLGVVYGPEGPTATITTDRQKLGVTYRLVCDAGKDAAARLEAAFPAADTAELWALDYREPDVPQYRTTAYRAGVGTHCVVYLDVGSQVSDLEQTIREFDELAYPVMTELFASPPDRDGNGKLVILGVDVGDTYMGYFSSVNAYTETESMRKWGRHSNEMEMVYVNVYWGTLFPVDVVPHEYSHLLYNEREGLRVKYWTYHDEGLAECAIHAVYGTNQMAIDFYLDDANGYIADGLSLVNWSFGLYENYVQAYLFWTYLASQLDGTATYGELFRLKNANPWAVSAWIERNLGTDFFYAHMDNIIASWVQAETGPYGYNGMVSFPARDLPVVPAGTESVGLQPFAAALFPLAGAEVSYPGTEGRHIEYAGIDAEGNVDREEPFDVDGGVLVAYNANPFYLLWRAEHSGPDIPAVEGPSRDTTGAAFPAPQWRNPPPYHPERLDLIRAWQEAVLWQ